MTLYLADTTLHVDLERSIPYASAFVQWVADGANELATCLIILTEYYSGRNVGDRADMDSFIEGMTCLEITRAVAMQAARYRYDFRRRGVQLKAPDALIAATAREYGAVLVTENLKDFPMADVQMISARSAFGA